MLIYWICTQYLVEDPFALITASIRHGMEVISLWHCWGGMKPRFLWQWPSAHLHFLVSCFSFSSWQYLIDSLGFRSGEFAGQSSTPTPWSFNQLLVLLAVWAGAKSCWKMKSASLKSWSAERKHEVLQHILVNGCSDCWFSKNTMDQHQQMTLHPKSSQTVAT